MDWVYLLCAPAALLFLATWLATRLAPERITQLALALERRRSGLVTRRAHVAGFDMPYLEGGRGDVLLLIHGFGGDKDNFTRVARFLTPHYRVLIPDLPGFGEASRDPSATYYVADQVARLQGFLAGLGVARAHLGGNSMGGFIAAQLAASAPQAVGSVWLIDADGTMAARDTALMRHYAQRGENPLLVGSEAQFDATIAATTHKSVFLPRFARTALARRAVADFALHTGIMKQLHASPLLETGYGQLHTPALIVWGAQDRILNPAGAGALRQLFPDSRLRIMEGIGHLPMVEAPQLTAQEYLAYRRTLAPAAASDDERLRGEHAA
jgi:pimeloyl-ACP methyl ester carboxylesterase